MIFNICSHRIRLLAYIAAACAAFPASLHACAVCFGQSNDPNVVKAYSWGLFLLMGFTFVLLGFLAYAVWRIERRHKRVTQAKFEALGLHQLESELSKQDAVVKL